jgi:hypothetical protein
VARLLRSSGAIIWSTAGERAPAHPPHNNRCPRSGWKPCPRPFRNTWAMGRVGDLARGSSGRLPPPWHGDRPVADHLARQQYRSGQTQVGSRRGTGHARGTDHPGATPHRTRLNTERRRRRHDQRRVLAESHRLPVAGSARAVRQVYLESEARISNKWTRRLGSPRPGSVRALSQERLSSINVRGGRGCRPRAGSPHRSSATEEVREPAAR